ncbi:MAG TPA: protein kinase [Gemmatimonadaceae bacterium]|nr:protein kinase [Gemmatimonadaceae bacterium]
MTIPPLSSPEQDLFARVSRAVEPAYDIEYEVGRGGSGIVYRATDRRLKRSVALKILPPDLAFRSDIRERFMREAETSARLNHPNIVPIFSVDERDGLAWFVMALIEGESLGDRVRLKGAVPFADARRILREVADALSYAHMRGVVHRDIKPDNILIDAETNRAMVTDFGIARATTEGESRLTATGTAIGTPAYMSPEQCAGERELDGRSDLYSLGAVAYYMLTGQPPFDGPSSPVIMMKQVTELPASMDRYRTGIPDDLDTIVMRLLQKNPDDRFADGNALIAALDGAPLAPLPAVSARMDTLSTQANPRPMWDPIPGFSGLMEARAARYDARRIRRQAKELRRELKEDSRPLPDRIRSSRRHLVRWVGMTTFFFGVNAATNPDFWWAIFPAMGMLMGVMNEGGALWAAGARLRDVFGRGGQALPNPDPNAAALPPAPNNPKSADDAEMIAEVLAGPRGSVARQAVSDRRAIKELISRMSKSDREMLPDVEGTSEGLYQRIAELGRALHRLDAEVGPERLSEIDQRIAQSEQSPEGSDRERLLRLLRRQREMLASLLESRERLSGQYESAGLLLQNLKLDLIRMRSSGLQSGLADVTSVTQEARALSREIGYVLAAADELRDING